MRSPRGAVYLTQPCVGETVSLSEGDAHPHRHNLRVRADNVPVVRHRLWPV